MAGAGALTRVSTPAERAGGGHRPRRLASVPVMQSLLSQLLAHHRYSGRQSFRPQSILASCNRATSGSGRTSDNDRKDGRIGLWLPLILDLYSQKATKILSFSIEGSWKTKKAFWASFFSFSRTSLIGLHRRLSIKWPYIADLGSRLPLLPFYPRLAGSFSDLLSRSASIPAVKGSLHKFFSA